jgi:hypothetical protein
VARRLPNIPTAKLARTKESPGAQASLARFTIHTVAYLSFSQILSLANGGIALENTKVAVARLRYWRE